ncbi:MAG: hypothetical protein JWQ07_3219 [Ramlibacter sp.]|nr:hypothetical protein [Ramlibacter sp.]
MTFTAESLLALLIVGLYVNDSVHLLRANQAVLERGLRSGWVARLPTRRFTLLGKHVLMGGLLPPNTLLFKISWAMEVDSPASPGWEAYGDVLAPFQWAAAFLFVLIMVLLPIALVARVGDAGVITVLTIIYSAICGIWTAVWLARQRLGLTSHYCLKLGAEMLLCPPIAANLPRRISLQCSVDEDFVSACRRLLSSREWAATAERIAMRIDDELEAEDAGSSRSLRLSQRKEHLV